MFEEVSESIMALRNIIHNLMTGCLEKAGRDLDWGKNIPREERRTRSKSGLQERNG